MKICVFIFVFNIKTLKVKAEELKEIRKSLKLTQTQFAEFIGRTTMRTVQNWESGVTPVPDYVINKLKNDNAPNFVNEPISGYEALPNKNGNTFREHPNGGWVITAPMIPFNAYASFIEVYEDEKGYMQFENASFKVDLFGKGRYVAFTVIGDSMNGGGIDDTKHGAEVLARELQKVHWRDGFGETEYGWIIVTESGIMHKDIVSNINDEGCITLHSRNPSPEYKDFEIDINTVHSIWKVIKRTF